MPLVGQLVTRALQLGDRIQQQGRLASLTPAQIQQRQLKRLLRKAAYTQFGFAYHFSKILRTENMVEEFQKYIPVFNYNSIYKEWWHHTIEGKPSVCWPGKTKYFALSSGTSESASKRIPLTRDMIRAIKRASIKQIVSSQHFKLPVSTFEKRIMMLGGSTSLSKRGDYFEGDLSGVSAKKIPFWFHVFYKPGRKIAKEKDWEKKLNEIARKAPKWDVSIVVGVPAWIQIMLERIISYNQAKTIHDVWPNLSVYIHSGVSYEPYEQGFNGLFGKKVIHVNTYLASEGFIAFQDHPDSVGMKMLLSNGIFYEFIPFNEKNFDEDGELRSSPECYTIGEVEEGKDYALLLTTNAGAWRYLLGDVIRFSSKEKMEIIITGRTKHYLSLTGEHLSVDNMNRAIEKVATALNIRIREFAVAGMPHKNLFAHQWWIGCDSKVNADVLSHQLDKHVCELNDDYAIERKSALKEIFVKIIPTKYFYEWMRDHGKLGGQHKFPRVLRGTQLEEWMKFLEARK